MNLNIKVTVANCKPLYELILTPTYMYTRYTRMQNNILVMLISEWVLVGWTHTSYPFGLYPVALTDMPKHTRIQAKTSALYHIPELHADQSLDLCSTLKNNTQVSG